MISVWTNAIGASLNSQKRYSLLNTWLKDGRQVLGPFGERYIRRMMMMIMISVIKFYRKNILI